MNASELRIFIDLFGTDAVPAIQCRQARINEALMMRDPLYTKDCSDRECERIFANRNRARTSSIIAGSIGGNS